jgi:hypothetical protein
MSNFLLFSLFFFILLTIAGRVLFQPWYDWRYAWYLGLLSVPALVRKSWGSRWWQMWTLVGLCLECDWRLLLRFLNNLGFSFRFVFWLFF